MIVYEVLIRLGPAKQHRQPKQQFLYLQQGLVINISVCIQHLPSTTQMKAPYHAMLDTRHASHPRLLGPPRFTGLVDH